MILCDHTWPGKIIWAKTYRSVISLIVLRYVYYPGSTKPTPGTPGDGPLITLLCGAMLQVGGVGCIRSLTFQVIS